MTDDDGELKPEESELEKAIRDSEVLIVHSARAGISIEESDFVELIKATEELKTAKELKTDPPSSAAEEAQFWRAFAKVNKQMLPVTADSIRFSDGLKDLNNKDWSTYWYTGRTMLILAVVLVCQIYWLIGRTLADEAKDLDAQANEIEAEISANLAEYQRLFWRHTARLEAAKSNEPVEESTDFQADVAPLDIQLVDLENRRWATDNGLVESAEHLDEWLTPWKRLPFDSSSDELTERRESERTSGTDEDRTTGEAGPRARRERVNAEVALAAVDTYILPLLYGLLGAAVSVLRSMKSALANKSYTKEMDKQVYLRLALGMVAGLFAGWFRFLLPGESALDAVPSVVLAFLVGYNGETIFSAISRFSFWRDDPDKY